MNWDGGTVTLRCYWLLGKWIESLSLELTRFFFGFDALDLRYSSLRFRRDITIFAAGRRPSRSSIIELRLRGRKMVAQVQPRDVILLLFSKEHFLVSRIGREAPQYIIHLE